MLALKDLMAALGSRQPGLPPGRRAAGSVASRFLYVQHARIAGIEDAEALLIVGSNPRKEAPVLNARIRKRWLACGLPIGMVGPAADLTYPARHLGDGTSVLAACTTASHDFAKAMREAKQPMVILGQARWPVPTAPPCLPRRWRLAAEIGALTPDWHGFNVLHTAAARVGALDLGFVPGVRAARAWRR